MEMNGDWRMPKGDDRENRYIYNGKKLTGDIGLGLHDYGARWYIFQFQKIKISLEKY